jgi:SAM-dependent methyltransferase
MPDLQGSMDRPQTTPSTLAAVELTAPSTDAVSHSLAVLATVYHYNHWIFSVIRDFLGPAVLEVGSGTGNITQFLLNSQELCCLEPYEPYRRYHAERFAKHLNVAVLPHRIQDCPNADVPAGRFDSVICLNVLEHIEDHVQALRAFKQVLKKGGKAIVFVPALPIAFGEMDRAMGHHRRYTLGSLRRAFLAADLRPIRGRYMNMAGALPWWWRGRVRRKSTIPESQTRLFDRMVPLLSAMERIIRPPLGQSVLLVGEA